MNKEIIIREAEVNDAAELLSIYRPYVEDTAITFEYETPSLEEFQSRIVNIKKRYPYLIAIIDGEIVGYAYATTFKARAAYDWSVETTVYIRHNVKRKGIGRALYTKLEAELKRQNILNMNACIACPKSEDEHLTNDSILFHKRMGFTTVGTFHDSGYKFNRWYNMTWMEKSIGEHTSHQQEIILYPELRKR